MCKHNALSSIAEAIPHHAQGEKIACVNWRGQQLWSLYLVNTEHTYPKCLEPQGPPRQRLPGAVEGDGVLERDRGELDHVRPVSAHVEAGRAEVGLARGHRAHDPVVDQPALVDRVPPEAVRGPLRRDGEVSPVRDHADQVGDEAGLEVGLRQRRPLQLRGPEDGPGEVAPPLPGGLGGGEGERARRRPAHDAQLVHEAVAAGDGVGLGQRDTSAAANVVKEHLAVQPQRGETRQAVSSQERW